MKNIIGIKRLISCMLIITLMCGMFFQTNVKAQDDNEMVRAPKNVKVYRYSATSLKVKWSPSKKVDGYVIYRYSKAHHGYVEVKKIDQNTVMSWVNMQLKPNKTYKYRVSAYKNFNGNEVYSKMSRMVKAVPNEKYAKKVNTRALRVTRRKLTIGLCSSKKIKARLVPSRNGKNENRKVLDKKIRWYSSNKNIATVDKNGVITAGKTEGTCYVYAVAHNGKQTKITVRVKNFAKIKHFYNLPEEDDLYILLTEYKDYIQEIAEYYSAHRPKRNEMIRYTLNDDAIVEVKPVNTQYDEIKDTINTLLVYFPYYVDIEVYCDRVDFFSRMEDSKESLLGTVTFAFDNYCSKWWDMKIGPHWITWRFYPD